MLVEKGEWMNRSRRPHSFGKQGSGNLSNWEEHVLGPWIGKQQAGPYVSLCHKDALAYLPWQTGLPETINLARFIKIEQWPLTSPLSVQQMPRSDSIGLERSFLSSVKHPRPESGWQETSSKDGGGGDGRPAASWVCIFFHCSGNAAPDS